MASADRLALPNLGPADNAIFIVSRGNSVEGLVKFFGEILHPFRLATSYSGPTFNCAYVVDPFREVNPAELRCPAFDIKAVPVFADQRATNDALTQAVFEERLSRIMDLYFERYRTRTMNEIIRDVVRSHPGPVFTKEMIDEIAERIARTLMRVPSEPRDVSLDDL
jgi:hypothetical protein